MKKGRTYFQDLVDLPELKKLENEPLFYHHSGCKCVSCNSKKGGNMRKESSFKDLSEREVANLCAEDKPTLKLVGQDGNVFNLLGLATRCARKENWAEEKIKRFQEEAMSGDYNHALQTLMDYFEVV